MRVIYTLKEMSKNLGCALYIRRALSIEKYGNHIIKKIVHQVGHFPELYEDARSEKYKKGHTV
jgi:hypothetical protein